MQGIDTKKFVFNDVRSILIPNPTNSNEYLITIQADVNGYTYSVATLAGTTQFTASELYGQRAGQFDAQGMFYDQYQMDHVEFDLTLSQGGAVMSISPTVTQVNPNGESPFIFDPTNDNYINQLSSAMNVSIHNPYQATRTQLNYNRWLISMSDRAWRQTRSTTSTGRELYPADGLGDQFFKLPSLVKAFTVTIPDGTFVAGAGPLLLGFLQFRTTYAYSQRRTDINAVVSQIVEKKEQAAREDEREIISQKLLAGKSIASPRTPGQTE